MFQIKQYLQYKNTSDGKPRVLVGGVDYHHKTKESLWQFDSVSKGFYGIASLSDCRPLLSVEMGTELDIIIDQSCSKDCFDMIYADFCSVNAGKKDMKNLELVESMFGEIKHGKNVVGSFFDDPAKYSKLLWNCSEEEGWKKVFKLLDIKL